MYCPVCFSNTLALAPRGLIHIIINGKKKDTGQFLFNQDKEHISKIKENLLEKIRDFMEWYSTFQNVEPVSNVNFFSSDFVCTAGCNIPLNTNISIIGILFTQKEIIKELEKAAKPYGISIEVTPDNL